MASQEFENEVESSTSNGKSCISQHIPRNEGKYEKLVVQEEDWIKRLNICEEFKFVGCLCLNEWHILTLVCHWPSGKRTSGLEKGPKI